MWFVPCPELHVSSPNQIGFSLLSVKHCYTSVHFIKSDNPTQWGYVPVSCRRDACVSDSVIFLHFTGNSFNLDFCPIFHPHPPQSLRWSNCWNYSAKESWSVGLLCGCLSCCSHWRRNREGQVKQQMEQSTSQLYFAALLAGSMAKMFAVGHDVTAAWVSMAGFSKCYIGCDLFVFVKSR